ncbi:MAG: ATP-binding protein [Rhodoferax sp.]
MEHLIPRTLFGRLALLLLAAVLASHLLVLTVMFELMGPRISIRPSFGAPSGGPPFLHWGLWLDIGVRLGALMLVAWVGARWVSQPVLRLASAARDLGRDIHRAPLVEEGTDECREATRVFNQMQAQICRQLGERDCFVAAVSHDLRTPLTRLALRTESLVDSDQRGHFARDIAEMNAMISATLDYLRGAAEQEPTVLLDMESALRSWVDDYKDTGRLVHMDDAHMHCAPLRTQVSALRRCIANLVDNAVRYGGSASIRCIDTHDEVCIEVSDAGPGICESELSRVLQPFYRLDASRNRNNGGVGLGLSIAYDIAQRLQGRLRLRNGVGGGLVASVTLPRSS